MGRNYEQREASLKSVPFQLRPKKIKDFFNDFELVIFEGLAILIN